MAKRKASGSFVQKIKQHPAAQVLIEMFERYFSDYIAKSAAEFAYFLIFSLFPMLLLVSSIISVLPISQVSILHVLQVLPREIQALITPFLTRYIGTQHIAPQYGTMAFGLLLTIYFISRTISSLLRSINRIYGLEHRRFLSSVSGLLFELLLAVGFIFCIFFTFVAVIIGGWLIDLLNTFFIIPKDWMMSWEQSRYGLAGLVMFLFLWLVNYICPNCRMTPRRALPGTAFTAVLWSAGTGVFTWYVENINRYNIWYGSLYAIMILLLWMYISGIVILLGAELNSILCRRSNFQLIPKGKPWYARLWGRIKHAIVKH
ncbi:MAG: YihY/virulence factor BrkB family protein [Butyricicoccaceae bacterium]